MLSGKEIICPHGEWSLVSSAIQPLYSSLDTVPTLVTVVRVGCRAATTKALLSLAEHTNLPLQKVVTCIGKCFMQSASSGRVRMASEITLHHGVLDSNLA
jgi:hypothetical protein